MKIRDMDVLIVNVPYRSTIASASSKASGATKCVVKVFTDQGLTGLGEIPGSAEAARSLLALREGLVDLDPFQVEYIMERLPGPHRGLYGPSPTVLSGVEMALWDLIGKASGQPVCQLMGGRYRETIPVCAPLFTQESQASAFAEETLDLAREVIHDYGFGAVKVKAGVYRPGLELDALERLRQELPPSLAIRLDPNGVWSPEETIRLASRFAAYDLEWLEDPTWGIEAMARVKAATAIPLATNMCVRNYDEIPIAFRLKAIDVLLGDPRIWGGMWVTRKVAATAEALQWGFALHSSHECGVATAARLHLAASTAHLSYAIDVTSWFHAADIITAPFEIRGGAMRVPDGPGLGVELDEEAIQAGQRLYEQEGDVLPRFTTPSRYRWWV